MWKYGPKVRMKLGERLEKCKSKQGFVNPCLIYEISRCIDDVGVVSPFPIFPPFILKNKIFNLEGYKFEELLKKFNCVQTENCKLRLEIENLKRKNLELQRKNYYDNCSFF